MGEIDEAFVQVPDHRPKLSTIEVDEIPVIDLSASETEKLAMEIGKAVEKVAKAFFHLPIEEKRKVKRDELNFTCYHDEEHTKNIRDWKEVFDMLIQEPTILPASPDPDDEELEATLTSGLRIPLSLETCLEYCRVVEKLAFRLLELISISLGLAANRLGELFKHQTGPLRLNYYPPCPFPELALGVGRHSDGGALTVLVQDDVGGLQIRSQSDGEWIPIKPILNAYIINIGDNLQVWSNDLYVSAEHRVVVNSQRERFSIPFFFFPSHYVTMKPLEELVNDKILMKYKEYNWGKYYVTQNGSNYKKLDAENVQIEDFKDPESV
ncbi:2-oxoglutarate (2OG) and Fe(II)-dependent oxygenase superfamily protein [Hibiscus syriacus]|uniref:2-oxoglutarate (2OG) and Fe(II)-dependent oxygenase superfamily protein n=1 Tax=Hibiscus syriacus TaxID=106335 RepID=A0A6A2X009_HIBSY|nr:2-oxoglutarate (2OG) and Fe(II)-dependent oxygenase superfamily protein [Hibiscus syriacus]